MTDKSLANKMIRRLALQNKWTSEIQDYDENYSTIDERIKVKGHDAELSVSYSSKHNYISLITGFAIRFPEKRLIDVTDACNYANRTGVIGAFTFLKEYAAGPAKIGHFVMAGPSIRLSNTVSLGGAANNTELVDVIFGEMSKAATQICEDWIDVFVALSKSKKTLDSILAAAGKYTPGVTVLKI